MSWTVKQTDDYTFRKCTKKKGYPSLKKAANQKNIALKMRGVNCNIYKCPICKDYHLSSIKG